MACSSNIVATTFVVVVVYIREKGNSLVFGCLFFVVGYFKSACEIEQNQQDSFFDC